MEINSDLSSKDVMAYKVPPGEYLSPLVDSVFKAIFKKNKKILQSFLNSILDLNIINPDDIQIADSEIPIDSANEKVNRLDLNCNAYICGKPHQINIEVQLLNENYESDRFFSYLSKLHGSYLDKGQSYESIPKTIGLIITNYNCNEIDYYNEYAMTNLKTGIKLTNKFSLYYLHLKKFQKTIVESDCIKDYWILFLKSRRIEDFNMLKYEDKELEAAVNELERASQNHEAVIAYARELRYRGREEFYRAKAISEAVSEAVTEEKLNTARSFKSSNVDVDIIASCTGLTREEVLAL